MAKKITTSNLNKSNNLGTIKITLINQIMLDAIVNCNTMGFKALQYSSYMRTRSIGNFNELARQFEG